MWFAKRYFKLVPQSKILSPHLFILLILQRVTTTIALYFFGAKTTTVAKGVFRGKALFQASPPEQDSFPTSVHPTDTPKGNHNYSAIVFGAKTTTVAKGVFRGKALFQASPPEQDCFPTSVHLITCTILN